MQTQTNHSELLSRRGGHMNSIRPLHPLIQKRTEGIKTYQFMCFQDGIKVIPDNEHSYKAYFSTVESLVKVVDMKIDGSLLEFDSKQLKDLPAGNYRFEIWEVIDDVVHGIYPSDSSLKLTVKENLLDLPEGTVSSLTLDEFEKRFDEIAKNIESGGTVSNPKFQVGKTESVDSDQPASVDVLHRDDGTMVLNFKIPKGKDGKTWKPYIADDGYWHIKEDKGEDE